MDAVFLAVLNRSIAAGWMVLAVVVLRVLLRRVPKQLRCHLWGLVILRLLLSPRKSPYSLIPSAQTIRPDMLLSDAPSIQTGFAAVDRALNPAFAESFAPAAGASVKPLQVWVHIGALVWLCGLAAMLLCAAVSYLRLRRRVADSVPLRDNIRLSDRIDSPFVLGLLCPRIYLPFGLDGETLDLVLAHEQRHIDRNDDWAKPFGFLFLALCWFHPLAWLAYCLFCRDTELACDEDVLRARGPEIKKAYSAALLACSTSGHVPGVCPLAFGQRDVKTRIRNVLAYRKPTFWVHLAASFAAALLCVFFLTDPVQADAPESAAPAESGQWSDFLAELIRVESEDGGYLMPAAGANTYEGPYSYLGYAHRCDAPLLRLPGAERYLTDSGLVFMWDDGERLRLKEFWYDETAHEALVVRWSPGEAEPDPLYGEGGLSYPEYSWSHPTVEMSFLFEDTWVNMRYYCSEAHTWGMSRLQKGMAFAPAESLLSPQQLTILQMSRLIALELGGYEPIERETYAESRGEPLTLPQLPARFRPGEQLYVIGAELEQPRFARLWASEDSRELIFASWRFNPGDGSPMQTSVFLNSGGLPDWVGFAAESRGKVSGADVVLRYYAADPDTDPETVRDFLEIVALADMPSPSS